jgi:cyclic pyranopterin phosphate synthase
MSQDDALSHVGEDGSARMVDVGGKPVTRRRAVAEAWVHVGRRIADVLRTKRGLAKGDAIETARLAGILAAKRTAELIPMCHPLPIEAIDVKAELHEEKVHIVAEVSAEAKTGVEMEALTAAAVAALTIYDMVKSAHKGIEIGPIRLLEKEGGKSGHWLRRKGTKGRRGGTAVASHNSKLESQRQKQQRARRGR